MMKMRSFALLILLAAGILRANGQVMVTGEVRTQHQTTLPGAMVMLTDEDEAVRNATDKSGRFEIEVNGGNAYFLEIRFLGYRPFRTSIEVGTSSTFDLGKMVLQEDEQQLQTIEVLGREQKNYTGNYSFSATKIGIKNRELPQSLSVVTKELIHDRQAYRLSDAVKTVSGVSATSFYNHFSIRGITQNEEGQIINGMRTHQYYFLQPITSNIERIEVLKGPASVTFSSVDPGGSINMVTKKPLEEARKEITFGVGSFSTLRGALDFTGPINEEKTLLYRLNVGVQRGKSYRDLVRNDALLFSPSISYVPDERTAVNVEMIYSDNNGTLDRGQPIFGAEAGKTDLNSTPISLSMNATEDYFRSTEMIIMANLKRNLYKAINFNMAYMKQTWNEDLAEHRTTNAFAVDINGHSVSSLVNMRYVDRQQFWDTDNLSAYFDAEFKTGKATHKLLVGYDLSRWHKTKGGTQNSARGYLLKDGTVANGFDPSNADNYQTYQVDGLTLPLPNVPHFDLSHPTYATVDTRGYKINAVTIIPPTLTTTQGAYVQHQLKIGKFSSLLSLRREWFEDVTNFDTDQEAGFKNSAIIPRIGLVYGIMDNINLYATYLEGYQPQSNTVTLMPSTGVFFWDPNSPARFKPLVSDLKEAGAKGSFFNGQLAASLSVYEVNQKNILMNANLPAYPDSLVQRGADRSRGLELDLTGFLLSNWQVNASYSYIDAEIMEDSDSSLIGQRKENTPVNSANFWSRYDFENLRLLRGFGIGLGVQYSSDKIPWFTREFTVPAYTLVDVAFYYAPDKSDFQLTARVDNLMDKTYWVGAQNYLRLFPGAPRNMTLTATYKF